MTRAIAGAGFASLVCLGILGADAKPAQAQNKTAPVQTASTAKARELVTVLQGRKLEAFAVRDPSAPGRYVAVLHVPGVQLMLVAAAYDRASDMDYRFYHKDYMNVYLDLRSGVLAKDKFFIEDAGADGLVALPGKAPLHDSVTVGTAQQTFDGNVDPKKRNQPRVSPDEYLKSFTDADAQYTRLLALLVEGLTKA